ncbi:leucine-rich repeat protein [Bacteroides sp. 51]|uniref:leucine-rich repeat protein n=1 Tax=Bacteroides sp. 51 TaxID=2302938 RepID=UPI0013D36D4F|nr:leucine-rich repeat protein [Bacteroides sp. 51]NDV84278.1 hypothetical protein [Bacteroides sp. 51]
MTLPSDNSESKTFEITSNQSWTIELSNTRTTPDWLNVSPLKGDAGTTTVTVKTQKENELYDDRDAIIRVKSGDILKTVTITQKKKEAILLSRDKVELAPDDKSFSIEVQSNISYEIIIPEESATWISKSATPPTRGLSTKTESFTVQPLTEQKNREGSIIFKKGDITETVQVFQTQKDELVLLNDRFSVSDEGEEALVVDLRTNIEYEITIPEKDKSWISITNPPLVRAIRNDKIYLKITPNETYDSRTSELIIKDKNSDLSKTLTITQVQKDALIISEKDFNVSSEKQEISITLKANITYEIGIPEDVKWITQKPLSRGLTEYKHIFVIQENESSQSRQATVTFTDKNTKISESVVITQAFEKVLLVEKTYEQVSIDGGNANLQFKSSGTYSVSIPEDATSWVSKTDTRGLDSHSVNFIVKPLTSPEVMIRKAVIEITSGNNLKHQFTIVQARGTYVHTAGTLSEFITNTTNTKELTLFGNINEKDLKYLKTFNVLESIDLSHVKLQTIPSDIFNSSKLRSIKLPEGLTRIEDRAFIGCKELTTINIPGTVVYIGASAFQFCSKLESVKIPAAVEILKKATFNQCSALNNVEFEESSLLHTIEDGSYNSSNDGVFEQCTNLLRIKCPKNLKYIGISAFRSSGIADITFNPGLKTIAEFAFFKCKRIAKVTIPASVESIQGGAFYECQLLTHVVIEQNSMLRTLGEKKTSNVPTFGVFGSCRNLVSINLPEKLTTIGARAFHWCDALKLTLPASLEYIGNEAFSRCIFETELTLPSIKEIGSLAFEQTSIPKLTFPSSLVTMGESVFSECKSLKTVTFADNGLLEIIPAGAFSECTTLETINIPANITTIGGQALKSTSISSLTFPANSRLSDIGPGAFQGSNLISISIPNNITKIEYDTFWGCSKLNHIDLPKELLEINSRAFLECTNLTQIVIPEKTKKIEDEAFSKCGKLTQINLPESLIEIGARVFESSGITSIHIPDNIRILKGTFYEARNLENVTFSPNSKLERIECYAIISYREYGTFSMCTSLEEIDLPKSLKHIGDRAFEAAALKEITIPENVTELGRLSFGANSALKKITLNKSLNEIKTEVFRNCTSLKEVIALSEFPPIISIFSTFKGTPADKTLKVPAEYVQAYKTNPDWTREFNNGESIYPLN